MKKTLVIYWSGTGNTEAMAGAVSVTIDVLGENTRRITISGGDFLADLSL